MVNFMCQLHCARGTQIQTVFLGVSDSADTVKLIAFSNGVGTVQSLAALNRTKTEELIICVKC